MLAQVVLELECGIRIREVPPEIHLSEYFYVGCSLIRSTKHYSFGVLARRQSLHRQLRAVAKNLRCRLEQALQVFAFSLAKT